MKPILLALALLLPSCAAQHLLSEPPARPRWPYTLPPMAVDSLAPKVVAMPDSLPILPWLLERAAKWRAGVPK
jgi:hypothetical protein